MPHQYPDVRRRCCSQNAEDVYKRQDYFRDAETRAAEALAAKRGLVIACGGGVIKRPVNIQIFKQSGVVVFIDRSPDDIVTDVDVASRPLLKEGKQKVYDLYDERIALYRNAADYTIANDKELSFVLNLSLIHI